MQHESAQSTISDIKLLRAHSTKIKKWVETVKELQSDKYSISISITRLISIKSLCQDEGAARHFGLYMAKAAQKQMNGALRYESTTVEEWEIHRSLMMEAITVMESYIKTPTDEGKRSLSAFLRHISQLQGDNFRRIHGTTIHFVNSAYLLKLEYAIRCFTDHDFPNYAYKLARDYTESYEPSYGTGLIPDSAPKLLEISEFWCQYYFGQNLNDKFPKLMGLINS
ncbi:unknown protein [Calothrix sp. PCC 7716]|nr:unknown protein [Calothrix sp. PCC 7716]